MTTTGDQGARGESPLHAGNAPANQYLTFMLEDEEYGIDILRVQGIQGWGPVTPLPGTPPFVLGVINLRGAVVPIIDLRRRFGLAVKAPGPTTVVIVVKVLDADRARTVGIVVDAVSEVYNIAEHAVKEAPDLGAAVDTAFLLGLVTLDSKLVILLDIDHLISAGIMGSNLLDDPIGALPGEPLPGTSNGATP